MTRASAGVVGTGGPDIWLEIADLQTYFSSYRHPSGTQRVILETIQAAWEQGRSMRLCRMRADGKLVEVPQDWVDVVRNPPGGRGKRSATTGSEAEPVFVFKPSRRERFRVGCQQVARGMGIAVNGGKQLARACTPDGMVPLIRRGFGIPVLHKLLGSGMMDWNARLDAMGAPAEPKAGDIICSLGAPWANAGWTLAMDRLLARSRARYAFLCYDIIPVSHPFYYPVGNGPFREWLDWSVRHACFALAISRHTAKELDRHRQALGAPTFPTEVIRLGDTFRVAEGGATIPPLLAGKPYVLFVSTIEARKNHRMLFDAWRLLSAQLGDACPRLVWVGSLGWLVGDLLTSLKSCENLGGQIVHLQHVSDGDLSALYRGAWLTVYPSLVEGWGLPVGESLAHGKVCIASQESSMPEVGGDLALYIDPYQPRALVELLLRLHRDPAEVAQLERRIEAEWRPSPWSLCSRQILDGLERALVNG